MRGAPNVVDGQHHLDRTRPDTARDPAGPRLSGGHCGHRGGPPPPGPEVKGIGSQVCGETRSAKSGFSEHLTSFLGTVARVERATWGWTGWNPDAGFSRASSIPKLPRWSVEVLKNTVGDRNMLREGQSWLFPPSNSGCASWY